MGQSRTLGWGHRRFRNGKNWEKPGETAAATTNSITGKDIWIVLGLPGAAL